ncbi:MAG: hypothetical protein IK990_01005 [Ruminiclostridium sp.]|nr:hypothetical protein [Ruminiclostridium sp.]
MKVYKTVAVLAAILLISGCGAVNDIPENASANTETIEVLKTDAPEYLTTAVYQFDEPMALDEKEGKLLLEQTALSWAERKVGEWLAASDILIIRIRSQSFTPMKSLNLQTAIFTAVLHTATSSPHTTAALLLAKHAKSSGPKPRTSAYPFSNKQAAQKLLLTLSGK